MAPLNACSIRCCPPSWCCCYWSSLSVTLCHPLIDWTDWRNWPSTAAGICTHQTSELSLWTNWQRIGGVCAIIFAGNCNKCVVNQRHKNTFRTSGNYCCCCGCSRCCCCCCSTYIAATMTMSKPKSRCRSRRCHRLRLRRERQPRAAAGVASHNSQSAAQFLVAATGNMTTPAAAERGKRGEARCPLLFVIIGRAWKMSWQQLPCWLYYCRKGVAGWKKLSKHNMLPHFLCVPPAWQLKTTTTKMAKKIAKKTTRSQ